MVLRSLHENLSARSCRVAAALAAAPPDDRHQRINSERLSKNDSGT